MDMIFSYLQDATVALVAAAACAGIALAALWRFVSDLRRSGGSLNCAWSRDANQPNEGETRWLCASCGAFSFGSNGSPPVTCRKLEPKQSL